MTSVPAHRRHLPRRLPDQARRGPGPTFPRAWLLGPLLATAIIGVAVPGTGAAGPDATAADSVPVTATAIVIASAGELEPTRRARLQAAMEKALRGDRSLAVRSLDEQLADQAGQIPHAVISEARGLVEVGEALLVRQRARAALPRLQAAVAQLGQVLAHVNERELARAQFLLGAAQAEAGDQQAARATFETLLTWQPAFVPDAVQASKPVTAAWEAARAVMRERPAGALDLVTNPAGAEVHVDGRLVGLSPTNADGLSVGTHYVSFRLGGYQHVVQEVPVYKGMRRAVEVPLKPSPRLAHVTERASVLAAASGDDDQDARQAAMDLAKLVGVTHAVVVVVPPADQDGGRWDAVVYDTASGRRLSAASAPMREDTDALLAELARTLYGQVAFRQQAAARDSQTAGQRAPGRKAPVYQRWWFWTGVAAAAAAVAIPVILLQDDGGPRCPGGSICGDVLWRF